MNFDAVQPCFFASYGRLGEGFYDLVDHGLGHRDRNVCTQRVGHGRRAPRRRSIHGHTIMPGMPELLENSHAVWLHGLHELGIAGIKRGIEHVERRQAGRVDRENFKNTQTNAAARTNRVVGDQIVIHDTAANPGGMGSADDAIGYRAASNLDRFEHLFKSHDGSPSLTSILPLFAPPSISAKATGALSSPSTIVSCQISLPQSIKLDSSLIISGARS